MNVSQTLADIFEYIFFIFYFIKWSIRSLQSGYSDSVAYLDGKTAIVTGGNEGIGLATSTLLASRGCKVIIACRSDATNAINEIIQKTRNEKIERKYLDLSSFQSIRKFADDIKKNESTIDILINNAGAGGLKQKLSEDGLNALMQTNFFGAFLLTHLLIEPLKASQEGRIVFTGSFLSFRQQVTLENLNDTSNRARSQKVKTYGRSKFCNILAGQEFGKKLKKHGIMVNTADTGAVSTDIWQKSIKSMNLAFRFIYFVASLFFRDTFNGAQTTFHLATSEKLKNTTGQYYFRCEPTFKMPILNDEKYCKEIWDKCEELVQLRPNEKLKDCD